MIDQIDFTHFSLFTLIAIYASGFLVSLTPCIYPMIPIVIGYLGNQTGGRRRRLLAALSFVLGLSLVYTAMGLAAALTGKMFGEVTMNIYVYVGFGIFLLFLGGSMMDWYSIPLPRFLQAGGDKAEGAVSLKTSFLVGASSGLVASPCSAPVVVSLLFYIATQKQFFRGAVMMLVFSLGMNTLLLILGISAGFVRTLPHPGIWMVAVKKLMAFLILGSGLYFIFRAGQLFQT
ncbi:MAG: sulfite exporter TauE/SafE family protein [Deltaproteobacteria bacterium]|nr:sulfite exporter TauE/SafE family protein [Deltaproteobacteria bacterium]